MDRKSVVPVGRGGGTLSRFDYDFPFGSLRREMDRLFDEFTRHLPPVPGLGAGALAPRTNVVETDGEIEITAELPGLEVKDVTVTLAENVLTIRGEKQAEREEKGKEYRLAERSYGSFTRSFEVPIGLDAVKVTATIDKGVLTVKFPKPAQPAAKKIEIKAAA
jgi:HSP20 family protein